MSLSPFVPHLGPVALAGLRYGRYDRQPLPKCRERYRRRYGPLIPQVPVRSSGLRARGEGRGTVALVHLRDLRDLRFLGLGRRFGLLMLW